MKPIAPSQESVLITAGLSIIGSALAPMLLKKLANTSFRSILGLTKTVAESAQGTDVVSATQSARVEPIIMLDQRVINVPFIGDTVKSVFNLFTSYWLLSVALDNSLNGVTIKKKLDRFATDRDLAAASADMLTNAGVGAAFESYALPFMGDVVASLEAQQPPAEEKKGHYNKVDKPRDIVNSAANLMVGHVIEVSINNDGKEIRVPVSMRLRPLTAKSSTIVQIMAVGGVDDSVVGRWKSMRAGEIRFWSDWFMSLDRVDAHRAAMGNDESGYYKAVYNRDAKGRVATAMGAGPSIATASAMIVIDRGTAEELEREIGAGLNDYKTRQRIFGTTFSVFIVVVDADYEEVTLYTRGIAGPGATFTKNDLKFKANSDSKELMDMLQSFQLGRSPGRG